MTFDHVGETITAGTVSRLLKEMVAIPSETGSERQLGDYLHQTFEVMGLGDIRRIPVEDSGDTLFARMTGSGEGPKLMFNFHQDTFGICGGWSTDPLKPVESDGRVYGLGSHDMKGGGAAVLAALQALSYASVDLNGSLMVSATTDEENWSRGAHALLKSGLVAGCDGCLIPEPTPPGRLRIGSRGRHVIRISITGESAHAAYTGEGINAVADGARIVSALEKLDLGWSEAFNLAGSICVIEFSGGRNIILVPEQAHLLVDRHILPGETIEDAVTDIRDAIGGLGLASRVTIDWDDRPTPAPGAYLVDQKSPFVRTVKDHVERQLGRPVDYALARSVADTNHFAVYGGIPTLVYGPEGGNTCMANEFVNIDSIVTVARAYCGIAIDMLTARHS